MKKRLLSLVLAAVMLLALLPSAAFAAELDTIEDTAPNVSAEETPEEVPGESDLETPEDVPSEVPPEDDVLAVTAAAVSDLAATQEDVNNTPLGNLVRPSDTGVTVSATASSEEDANVPASGAIDGLKSGNYRWASSTGAGPHWLRIDLGAQRAVAVINVYWERDNVIAYNIQGSQDGSDWATLYTQTQRTTGRTTHAIQLDAPVRVRYLKITTTQHQEEGNKYSGGNPVSWNNVSIMEVEAYRSPAAVPADPAAVAAAVEFKVENGRVVPDLTSAAAVAGDWEFDYTFAANLEQVVGADGTVYTPLVNTQVELDVTATRRSDGVSATTPANAPCALIVPGEHVANVGNPKPKVIPELMEWYSSAAQRGRNYTLTSTSKIVAPTQLTAVAEEVKADILDLFGFDLPIAATGAAAGDIVLVLDAAKAQEGFDDETYLMEVTDRVTITASHATGVYWGTRSALQALQLSHGNNTIPQGTARDYPEFPLRGFVLDVGRKPFSMDTLYDMAKNMAWYKLNDFHIHLNDNLIWIEDYGFTSSSGTQEQYEAGNNAYSAFRLESSLQEEEGALPLAARDYHYTKDEFRQFSQDSAVMGVTVVPEIDVPAHAKAIVDAFPSLREPKGFNQHALNDHFNLSGKFNESLAKTKEIFNDYLDGDNPVFTSGVVDFGADEYYPSSHNYRLFHKALIDYLKNEKHVTVRTWGSLTRMASNEADAQYTREEVDGVQMNIWSTGWADPTAMYNLGFDLINVTDGPFYMVPDGRGGRGAYGDYLDLSAVYAKSPNQIGSTWFPASSSQILGEAYAIWNDNIDTHASGLSEQDIFRRFYDTLPVVAVRQWGEGDRLDRTLDELQSDASLIGTAPQTNPYFTVEPNATSGKHFQYDFATDGSDTSGNNRTLTLHGATVTNGALTLAGGASYADIGMDRLGWDSSLSFTVTVTSITQEGVIFEGEHAYGDFAIKALPVAGDATKWRLGFSRELYDYEFPTDLTVGQSVQLTITTAKQSTTLSVNGGTPVAAVGKFVAKPDSNTQFRGKTGITNSSFELPVARIGSTTNSFVGTIDAVSATSPTVEPPQVPEEGTQLVNLALNRPVVAQSSGQSSVSKVTDGNVAHGENTNNAWLPNAMLNNGVQTPQWFVVDLGEDVEGLSLTAEKIALNYWRQGWPQKYKIQTTSDDPTSASAVWTDLVTVERTGNNGWIGSVTATTSPSQPIHQEASRSVGGYSLANSDVIETSLMQNGGRLHRYVRVYLEEVQPGITQTPKTVPVIEFLVFARLPETESAEHIKAYQFSDSGVYLTWADQGATYYQVYAKAPGGEWTCVSGDEVVDGNAFNHTGYVSGMVYRVLTPGSHPESPTTTVTPMDIRSTGEGGYVLNTATDRITYSGPWESWSEAGSYIGPSVTFCNNPTADLTAEFVFAGVGVQLIGGMRESAGRMTVEIDGEPAGVANYHNGDAGTDHQQVVYEQAGLENGVHTIKLTAVANSGVVEIEAFRVLVPAQGIALSADGLTGGAMTLTAGGSAVNVTAAVSPANGWGELTWTTSGSAVTVTPSDDPKVAAITPVLAGTATVTVKDARNETVQAQINVTVNPGTQPEVHVTQVTLPESQQSATLYLEPTAGQSSTLQLTPTVLPENAANRSVTYSSNPQGVATVSQSGLITAVAAGETVVTVTTVDGGYTATCQVTVRGPQPVDPGPVDPGPDDPGPVDPPAPSGGNGGGTVVIPNITTGTSDNPDGSSTTTETNNTTGAVTTTTQWPDGKVVETVKDAEGGVTITVTNADGEEDAQIVIPGHIPAPETDFVDVPDGHWAGAAIDDMAGLGLVQGIGGGQYDMTSPMTRGSLATVFYRLSHGQPNNGVTSFLDVDDGKWYAESINWAATRGVVQGYTSQTFAPNDAITREQLAVMLARYAQLIGLDTQADRMVLGAFADGANTSAWAEMGIAWCVKMGILRGKDAGALDPGANVTRAEVAVMLQRFIDLL